MIRTTTISLLLLSLIPGAQPAAAEERTENLTASDVTAPPSTAAPATWTFQDCVDWATANSTDMRRTLLKILEADQDVASAKDAWLPSVGFSTSQSFRNLPSPAAGQKGNTYSSTYDINASWTVWEGNARKYRLESAKLLRKQQTLAGDDIVRTLRLGILQAYLDILYAGEAVTVAEQTLEVSTAQTERARRLMESGRTSKVDYAQIESQKAQDAYNLVQAQNNLATAKMNLKKILELGLDADMEIARVDFPDSEVLAALPEAAAVYESALAWLPEIKSNELSKEIYANDVKSAKAGSLPTISLSAGAGTSYISGGPGWGSQAGHNFGENIGLSLSVPIYDGNATRRAVAKAKLASLEYDLSRKNLLDNLSQTIESLYIDSRNAMGKYRSGLTQLEAAQLTDDLTNRQFELGLVNPLELLTAHNNLLNAKLELLMNKYMAILANKTIQYYATQEVALP